MPLKNMKIESRWPLTKNNFITLWPAISFAVKTASFIAIDLVRFIYNFYISLACGYWGNDERKSNRGIFFVGRPSASQIGLFFKVGSPQKKKKDFVYS